MALVLRMSEANAKLPGPEREVLALLSDSGFGYAEIGELLGVGARTVAEIAARARLRLAKETLPELPEPCAKELPYLAARIDGEALASSDREHGKRCLVCRGNLDAMRIADAGYRAWAPAQMPDRLRDLTRAQIQAAPDGGGGPRPRRPSR
jgi:sigma-70-like protein